MEQKYNVIVHFDLSKVEWDDVREAEEALRFLGIRFDTGTGCGERDWFWDWSLEGPIRLEVRERDIKLEEE